MKKTLHDLPLNADPSSRLLPLIVGLMIYLATLAVMALISVHLYVTALTSKAVDHAMIVIPAESHNDIHLLDTSLTQLLNQTPGIKSYHKIQKQTIERTLQMTATSSIAHFLPLLYSIEFDPTTPLDLVAFQQNLTRLHPDAVVNNESAWATKIRTIGYTLEGLSLTIATFILLGSIATIAFTSQTSLIIHRKVIEMLYLVGGTNKYIARQFQRHALRVGLKGSVIGLSLTFITILLVCILPLSTFLGTGFYTSLPLVIGCTMGVPMLITLFMMTAAQITVRLVLRQST